MEYFYKRTEPTLWTVGYEDGSGHWHPDSDHGSAEEAARQVARLNGGGGGDTLKLLVEALRDQARWEDIDSDRISGAIAATLYRLADTLEGKQS